MKSAAPARSRSARRRNRASLVVASVLGHVTVLGLIGFSAPTLHFLNVVEAPPLTVWLTPDVTRQPAGQKESQAGPVYRNAAPTIVPARPTPAAPIRAPIPQRVEPEPSSTSQPQPMAGEAAGAATDAGGEIGAGVRAALRGRLGCDMQSFAQLTAEERARCSQHMAETAKLGPAYVDPVPMEKRAYYDAVQAAYQAARHPDAPFYRDANGNIQQWGHPPAIGCTFKRRFRPGASLSDKIKATGMIGVPIGPLSCGLALPQGSMTPELGLPTP